MSMQSVRLRFESLKAGIDEVYRCAGVPDHIRPTEVELMAEADLSGTASHGVRMLPRVIRAMEAGSIRVTPKPKLVREVGATCVFDGDCGPGRWTAIQAMDHAVARAKNFGVGVCVARNTCHWGRGHSYAHHAARQGFIGLCTTNAMVSILAFGSEDRLLANNPLAIAAPRGKGEPVVLDMAMSQAAVGKIETYRRAGKKAPLDWGLDSAGQPTDDPAAIMKSRKFLPMGGHKGAGLAMMMEILTAGLAGGILAQGLAARDASGADAFTSKFFLALSPAAFGEPADFESKVDELVDYIHAASTPGHELVVPGERGWRERARALKEGIEIDAQTWSELESLGFCADRTA